MNIFVEERITAADTCVYIDSKLLHTDSIITLDDYLK